MHIRPNLIHSLGFKTIEGFTFLNILQIVHFKAEGNVTFVYLFNQGKPLKVQHTFLEIEYHVLKTGFFFKCHRSHFVSIKHVTHFIVKTNILVTEAGEVPISDT